MELHQRTRLLQDLIHRDDHAQTIRIYDSMIMQSIRPSRDTGTLDRHEHGTERYPQELEVEILGSVIVNWKAKGSLRESFLADT